MPDQSHKAVCRRVLTPFGAAIALAGFLPLGAASAQGPSALRDAVETITPERVRDHLEVLASDGLLGRDTPSEGLEAAASYLADQHRANGLAPAGDRGSFLQRYPFALMFPDLDNARATVTGPGGRVEIRIGRDAFLDGGSSEGIDAALAFVTEVPGTGGEAESLAGRVAVFQLRGRWGQELWLTSQSQLEFARRSGAVAVIHLLESGFSPSIISQIGSALAEPTWRLGGDAALPRLFVRRQAIDGALPEGPWSDWGAGSGTGPAVQTIPGASLEAHLPLNVIEEGQPANVLAELRGADPQLRDEFVVLSAHFDHVGVGRPVRGDSIYNGADDNGSGTTLLLEVARALASLPPADRPRRSILFAHVSGEEKGLLGSEWWVRHPTRPIQGVVANLNTDMVGGDAHRDTIAVLGREYSSLGALITEVGSAHGELRLTPVSDLWPQEGLFFRSDQFNFMREEIPSVFFFAGFHRCYHQPCDDLNFVDTDKVARVSRLLAYVVVEIANREDRPEWTQQGLADVRRMTSGG